MKKLCVIVLLCLSFTSCSTVKDDVPVQILAAHVGEKIEGFENLAEASSDYIKYCTGDDLSLFSEYIILYPFAGTEYNEFGIFKVADKKTVSQAVSIVNTYVSFKKSNWDTRYMGEEFSKIENAKITTCGQYVLYTILSKDESKAVTNQFEKALKK